MFSTINLKFEMGNSSSISGRKKKKKKKTEREREGGNIPIRSRGGFLTGGF
jgi:hypothetical protein